MPFIGNQPALSYTSFAKQDFTTSATTSYTLDQPVANANELALFINFVRQEPTTAYTASGTTLTLTSATSATDDMYCVFLGKAVQTVNPPNASVGASQIVDASITSGKLASGVLPDNTPAFRATTNAQQSIANSTSVKVNFNNEIFDTDGKYDASNSKFTPTVAGYYYLHALVRISIPDDTTYFSVTIRKNGSDLAVYNSNNFHYNSVSVSAIDLADADDYYEVFTYHNHSGAANYNNDVNTMRFEGYKLIG